VFGWVTCWSSALLFMPWSLPSTSVRAQPQTLRSTCHRLRKTVPTVGGSDSAWLAAAGGAAISPAVEDHHVIQYPSRRHQVSDHVRETIKQHICAFAVHGLALVARGLRHRLPATEMHS
jgi:hypothetical protein